MADFVFPETPLNDRQKQFARNYVKCLNAAQAAIDAGYSEHSAPQIGAKLKLDKRVQRYIQELTGDIIKEEIATLEEVLAAMTEIMRDKNEKSFARIKAAERLAKMRGWEAPVQSQHNVTGRIEQVKIDLSQLTTDELENYLQITSKCIPQLVEDTDGRYVPEDELILDTTGETGDAD